MTTSIHELSHVSAAGVVGLTSGVLSPWFRAGSILKGHSPTLLPACSAHKISTSVCNFCRTIACDIAERPVFAQCTNAQIARADSARTCAGCIDFRCAQFECVSGLVTRVQKDGLAGGGR